MSERPSTHTVIKWWDWEETTAPELWLSTEDEQAAIDLYVGGNHLTEINGQRSLRDLEDMVAGWRDLFDRALELIQEKRNEQAKTSRHQRCTKSTS